MLNTWLKGFVIMGYPIVQIEISIGAVFSFKNSKNNILCI